MKYWKITFVLIFTFFTFCSDDVNKNIETDLTKEAAQFYQLSLISHEHLFFSLYSWEEYQSLEADSLPGCPTITLEEISKKVTLDFNTENECPQNEKYQRSGKITLDLGLSFSPNPEWYIKFEDYVFESDTVKGQKRFKTLPNGVIQESYNDLIVKTDKNLNYTYSGIVNHLTIRRGLRILESVLSDGSLEGINPAGRLFSMNNISPTISQALCFNSGEVPPNSGEESWTISRGLSKEVNHRLTFESDQNCETTASMVLPDGRMLILTP